MPPNIVEIILKGVDNVSKEFDKVEKKSEKLKKALKGITAAGAGLAVIGVTMKKAFDLGREGAVIEQTSESFDFLMQKVGAAPDLLDQLTAASHETISAFDLQSSTMTLLAGAQGELATQLANSTPRLMEIAKAANKLNPALGTTAFMYESIATGVKRAQPLILDNLGLTLKVGEANEAYAKSLGITVEQMTAQDKAMAILNATLEAGDTLIAQVGGTTDAATDSFDQMTVALKESGDAIKTKLFPFLEKAAKAINLLLTRAKKLDVILEEHAKEVWKTSDSYKAFIDEMERAEDQGRVTAMGWDEILDVLEHFGLITREASRWTEEYTQEMFDMQGETENSAGATFELLDAIDALRDGTEETAEELDNFAEILIETETAADKARAANKKFLDGLDPAIDSPIDAFIKDIEWFLATGGQFEAAFLRVKELAKTAPEEALTIAEDLFGMVIDTQEEMGLITADEAAENLKSTLGMELWETRRLITGSGSVEEAMRGLGDVYIDLGELERMEAITLRILQNLNLMRTTGIGVGAAGQGFPVDPGPPAERPTTDPGGRPSDIPSRNLPEGTFAPGGSRQTFNIFPSNDIDVEEMVGRIAQSVSEN